MKKSAKLLTLAAIFSFGLYANAQCEYEEKDGLVIMEAENTTSAYDLWILKTDVDDYKGSGHLEFTGNNTGSGPAQAPLTYTFKINEGGMYQLLIRARKRIAAGDTGDRSNDCYVKVAGDYDASPDAGDNHQDDAQKSTLLSNTKIYGGNPNSWGWAGTLDLGGHDNKRSPKYIFKAGETYTLTVSGRSKQFNFDRIMFFRLDDYSSAGARSEQESLAETACESDSVTVDTPDGVSVSGTMQRWHKITLDFEGPESSETANLNPFTDYRLDITFTKGNASYTVPGYYAACENPADSSCESGNVWRAHFAPDSPGTWNWSASFTTGSDVAVNGGGSVTGFNGATGTLEITESDKSGRDFRSANLGRLQYVGEHYLRHSGTNPANPNGPWFLKAGSDSPENAFNYEDFDATPDFTNTLNKIGNKSWEAHQVDYNSSDASDYTWANGEGTEMLGVINYLSSEGVNAMSFLTWNTGGDGGAVFPHLFTGNWDDYTDGDVYKDVAQWNLLEKDRFDVSKLAQWEKVMEYADKKGVYLHMKTMETENDNFMDNNSLGRERKLYYRELIARFGHHLALNWNITEETTLDADVTIDIIDYINDVDPYDHNIVIHTYPSQKNQRYTPLLGNASKLTGASLQITRNSIHNEVQDWVERSEEAGRKWVVANDEQGPSGTGVRFGEADVRNDVLYATLMAGGAGVEYYYGYTDTDGDINNQNHRLRGDMYQHGAHALNFFNAYLQDNLINMQSNDGLTSANDDYVFAEEGEIYAVYLPEGGSTTIDLPANNDWVVQWYNPRTGGDLSAAEAVSGSIEAPNSSDWLALITANGSSTCQKETALIEAECFDGMSGIQTENATENNLNVGYINNGDWVLYEDIDLSDMQSINARVACNFEGGTIEVRTGSTSATLIGNIAVENTGGNQDWVTLNAGIDNVSGTQDVYLVFTGGAGYLFNLNYFGFSAEATLSIDTAPLSNTKPSIYPTVVNSAATVANAENLMLNLYDMNGKVVLTKEISSANETIALDKFSAGVYYVEMSDEDSRSIAKIIIR